MIIITIKLIPVCLYKKLFLRTNYQKANSEEDINMKNQFKIENLPCRQENSDAVCKSYVNNIFSNSSILKNTAHIEFNCRNITIARFNQVNQWPQIVILLTAKLYVVTEIDQQSLVRNNQDNDFNNTNLTNINSTNLKKQAEKDNEVITKAYVDQFHQENEQ